MKLNQLRDIVAVAERGSLRAAARHLAVAQPALTRSVRDLERELGAPLFERRARGMSLTAMGVAFVRRANAHDLAYLTDTSPEKNSWANPSDPGNRSREEVVRLEQEMDFITGRTFRRSLLCRADAPIDLTRRGDAVT